MRKITVMGGSVAVLLALEILGPGPGYADSRYEKWEKAEQAEVDSRVKWSHVLSARVRRLQVAPGGLVVVDVRKDVKRKEPTPESKRYIIEGATGVVVWEGPVAKAAAVTGRPYPVILEAQGHRNAIRAFAPGGRSTWQRQFSETFMATVAFPERGLILALTIDPLKEKGATTTEGRLHALSLDGGKLRWTAPVGMLEIREDSNGSQWVAFGVFVTDKDVFIQLDNFVHDIALNSGTERWRQVIRPKAETWLWRTLWQALGSDVVLSVGPQVMRLSPERGVVWSYDIEGFGWVHGLAVDSQGIAAGLHSKDKKADNGVLLIDAVSGKKKWRQIVEKPRKERELPVLEGVVMTRDRVFVGGFEKLSAFDRQTGKRLFKVKTDDGYTSLVRRGSQIVLKGRPFYYPSAARVIEARAMSDGEELWKRRYLTPLQRYKKKIGIAEAISDATKRTGLLELPPGTYYLHRPLGAPPPEAVPGGPHDTMYEVFDAPELGPSGQAAGGYAYSFATEGRNIGKPVVFVVDLNTGAERMYRLPKGGGKCAVTIVPVEEEGYVIEGFEGWMCKEFGKRIRAVRIPID